PNRNAKSTSKIFQTSSKTGWKKKDWNSKSKDDQNPFFRSTEKYCRKMFRLKKFLTNLRFASFTVQTKKMKNSWPGKFIPLSPIFSVQTPNGSATGFRNRNRQDTNPCTLLLWDQWRAG